MSEELWWSCLYSVSVTNIILISELAIDQDCNQSEFKVYLHSDFGSCHIFQPKVRSIIDPFLPLNTLIYIPESLDENSVYQTDFVHSIGGLRIAFIQPGHDPAITALGFNLHMGYSAQIDVTQSKVERLGLPYTNCIKPQYCYHWCIWETNA